MDLKRKPKSIVWRYFEKENDPNASICKLCKNSYKHGGNTTNLLKHLHAKHSDVFDDDDRNTDGIRQNKRLSKLAKEFLLS